MSLFYPQSAIGTLRKRKGGGLATIKWTLEEAIEVHIKTTTVSEATLYGSTIISNAEDSEYFFLN